MSEGNFTECIELDGTVADKQIDFGIRGSVQPGEALKMSNVVLRAAISTS